MQHSRPDILFLCHCVPNPPNKGEKIRAFFLLQHLVSRYRVHLVCFGRNRADLEYARKLEPQCASVYVELLTDLPALARATVRYAFGQSLTVSFYRSWKMARYVRELQGRVAFTAAVAFSVAMAPYTPPSVPLWLDMVDVDSEKWFEYSQLRRLAVLYRTEGRRLRKVEHHWASRACHTYLTTELERRVLKAFVPTAAVKCMGNGVDFNYFDPAVTVLQPEWKQRPIIVFVGAMDYYPNADGCRWFAAEVFPQLRRTVPGVEFFIVGRNPGRGVRELSRLAGITVTGAVDDVRPHLAAARAVVAPLRIARGVQNKVLESLAMGKRVFASPAVCATLGVQLPAGIVCCDCPSDYVNAISRDMASRPMWLPEIRSDAMRRFCWDRSMGMISADLEGSMALEVSQSVSRES